MSNDFYSLFVSFLYPYYKLIAKLINWKKIKLYYKGTVIMKVTNNSTITPVATPVLSGSPTAPIKKTSATVGSGSDSNTDGILEAVMQYLAQMKIIIEKLQQHDASCFLAGKAGVGAVTPTTTSSDTAVSDTTTAQNLLGLVYSELDKLNPTFQKMFGALIANLANSTPPPTAQQLSNLLLAAKLMVSQQGDPQVPIAAEFFLALALLSATNNSSTTSTTSQGSNQTMLLIIEALLLVAAVNWQTCTGTPGSIDTQSKLLSLKSDAQNNTDPTLQLVEDVLKLMQDMLSAFGYGSSASSDNIMNLIQNASNPTASSTPTTVSINPIITNGSTPDEMTKFMVELMMAMIVMQALHAMITSQQHAQSTGSDSGVKATVMVNPSKTSSNGTSELDKVLADILLIMTLLETEKLASTASDKNGTPDTTGDKGSTPAGPAPTGTADGNVTSK